MANEGKGKKITKDQRTSRRKRTEGHFGKSNQLRKLPFVKLFVVMEWTDDNRIVTYDSTDGKILEELEKLKDRLPKHPRWEKRGPAYYEEKQAKRSKPISKRKTRLRLRAMDEPRKCLRPVPIFDVNKLPMYSKDLSTQERGGAASESLK